MSATFAAKWGGKCAACGGGIAAGDDATYADDSVVHADCLSREIRDPLAAARPICGSCFTEPAANGSCGCDS